MTRQESFKRRVRARMETTGERYAVARRQLLAAAGNNASTGTRTWVAPPETSDDAVRTATGKGWDEWCDVIEASPVAAADHTTIAAHLQHDLGVDPWWAQTVTVGFERITGLRLPYQRPDGTFTAGKSRTVAVVAAELRAALIDADGRDDLFVGHVTGLLSAPTAKTLRIAIGPGVAKIAAESRPDGRTKVTVQHEKLPEFDDVERWRFYWSDWLDALESEAMES